jgi:Interferon-induced transmembrane protein/GYF domain 2
MWYYALGGRQQEGPVSDEQIRGMIQDGTLGREDLVWREGMAAWQPAGQVADLQFPVRPAYPTPPPPRPQAVAPVAPYAPPQYQAPPVAPYPAGYPQAGADIPDYLVASILVTLFCCVPGGIAAIIFANKANTAKRMGDLGTARQAAAQAKTWLIISVVLGLLVSVVYVFAVANRVIHRY